MSGFAPNPWLIVVALLAGIGLSVGAYRMGQDAKEGEHALQRQSDIAIAWRAGAQDLAAESKRAQRAELQRDAIAEKLREIDRETPVPPRPDCSWSAAEYGLLESRRAAHAEADRGLGASPVPDPVPGHAGDRSGSADDGERPAGLGLGLSGATAGMPRLGTPQK